MEYMKREWRDPSTVMREGAEFHRGEREMKVTGCTCKTGQTHIPRDNPVMRRMKLGTKSGVQVISVISESLQIFFGIVGQEMKCLDDSRRW